MPLESSDSFLSALTSLILLTIGQIQNYWLNEKEQKFVYNLQNAGFGHQDLVKTPLGKITAVGLPTKKTPCFICGEYLVK